MQCKHVDDNRNVYANGQLSCKTEKYDIDLGFVPSLIKRASQKHAMFKHCFFQIECFSLRFEQCYNFVSIVIISVTTTYWSSAVAMEMDRCIFYFN